MDKKTKLGTKKLIEQFVTMIKTHGGDAKIVGIKDNRLTLEMRGACAGCSLADISYNVLLRGLLKEKFPEVELILKKTKPNFKNAKTRIHKKQTRLEYIKNRN